jgi:NADH-quinone oxidoreductase subunit E
MPLSLGFYDRAQELMARYPTKRSALLLLLHDAQDEVGYITDEVIREIADLVGITAADVAGVVTFYTMYKRSNPGRYLISLCTNPGCQFFGAEQSAAKLRELVGPQHTVTEDGLCSWEEVECLAYCGKAPIGQINYLDVPFLTPARVEQLVTALRAGRPVEDVVAELQSTGTLDEGRALATGAADA